MNCGCRLWPFKLKLALFAHPLCFIELKFSIACFVEFFNDSYDVLATISCINNGTWYSIISYIESTIFYLVPSCFECSNLSDRHHIESVLFPINQRKPREPPLFVHTLIVAIVAPAVMECLDFLHHLDIVITTHSYPLHKHTTIITIKKSKHCVWLLHSRHFIKFHMKIILSIREMFFITFFFFLLFFVIQSNCEQQWLQHFWMSCKM